MIVYWWGRQFLSLSFPCSLLFLTLIHDQSFQHMRQNIQTFDFVDNSWILIGFSFIFKLTKISTKSISGLTGQFCTVFQQQLSYFLWSAFNIRTRNVFDSWSVLRARWFGHWILATRRGILVNNQYKREEVSMFTENLLFFSMFYWETILCQHFYWDTSLCSHALLRYFSLFVCMLFWISNRVTLLIPRYCSATYIYIFLGDFFLYKSNYELGSCLKRGQHFNFAIIYLLQPIKYTFFDSVSTILFKFFMYKSRRCDILD